MWFNKGTLSDFKLGCKFFEEMKLVSPPFELGELVTTLKIEYGGSDAL